MTVVSPERTQDPTGDVAIADRRRAARELAHCRQSDFGVLFLECQLSTFA